MAGAKRGLGRGLGALFGEDTVEEVILEEKATARKHESAVSETKNKTENHTVNKKQNDEKNAVARNNVQKTEKKEAQTSEKEILNDVQEISPQEQEKENRDQPRKAFDEEQLEELADSIRKYGVLQPLLVQKKGESYEIIAGERRWRAAKLAGLKMIPAVIREYSPQQAMEIALIENVQREDLNPIEEAQAYQRLMQEFSLKQEEIAERVSKNRTTITNCMRMSVREVEKAVKLLGKEKKEKKKSQVDEAVELVFQDMENRMKTVMGTKVNISRKDKSKGKIEIEYYSEAELERLVELIESIQPV